MSKIILLCPKAWVDRAPLWCALGDPIPNGLVMCILYMYVLTRAQRREQSIRVRTRSCYICMYKQATAYVIRGINGVWLLPYTSKSRYVSEWIEIWSTSRTEGDESYRQEKLFGSSLIFLISRLCVSNFWWWFWRIFVKFRKCWEVSHKIPSWFGASPTVVTTYQKLNTCSMRIRRYHKTKHTTGTSDNLCSGPYTAAALPIPASRGVL